MNSRKVRIIANYLPQYHPIPENDEWWGKGFTEWTNVAKARPLFRGHYQPHLPADLGFYDLRMPEVRAAQARLAREAGIEGFCYWHYWFGGGKRLLERPFQEVVASGQPDFPFCLGWANHDWSNKTWTRQSALSKERILMEQTYSEEDYVRHFHALLDAFRDKRYLTVDGKPLFMVFEPLLLPDAAKFISIWRELARKNGLAGIHFVGTRSNVSYRDAEGKPQFPKLDEARRLYQGILDMGFDAVNSRGITRAEVAVKGRMAQFLRRTWNRYFDVAWIDRYRYDKIIRQLFVAEDRWEKVYPTLVPNWDRSPRCGRKAAIYTNCTPQHFERAVGMAMDLIREKPFEHRILFVQSWNEWGEGNHLEPDLKYGHGYLEALARQVLSE
ncbi:MAG: glycoside hydrolase family 99-like domain-containing protein [Kiritimatiellia bacterium]|jgi:lipopolysaccharide biosynthesis protein|nr:glycoside hydrolase family 99-like domain-containing protein [Kiritimatiellia bacterium]